MEGLMRKNYGTRRCWLSIDDAAQTMESSLQHDEERWHERRAARDD